MKTRALDRFLRSVERKAFVIAEIATKNADDACDIVQDAMLKFAKNYVEHNEQEWPPLFFRVLRNQIVDFHRRHNLTQKIFSWFGKKTAEGDDDYSMDHFASDTQEPLEELIVKSELNDLLHSLKSLPDRQQQALLLRAWQGLSVKETASAMGCSDGSVKTHYSRAVHALRNQVKD